ncbi:MAG: sugar kinase [Planctomycetes bacterium]|nr:sugar kinase [Planctomycetota bacterium]
MSGVLVVGSIGYDTIETAAGRRDDVLGGSAVYFALAARLFSEVAIVGVVGEDFRNGDVELLRNAGVDTTCLTTVPGGKTFRWHGRYHDDMNDRDTVQVDLNVLGCFDPELPESHRDFPYVFLANGSTAMQLKVLEQVRPASPKVYFDTMNLWIETEREGVMKLVRHTDGVVLNDSEARMLTGIPNTVAAGRYLVEQGAGDVVVKKGEHGCIALWGDRISVIPAYPLAEVVDPTGAGDSFAGALMAVLASGGELHEALMAGTIAASFTCESFGPEKLVDLTIGDIRTRLNELAAMMSE